MHESRFVLRSLIYLLFVLLHNIKFNLVTYSK